MCFLFFFQKRIKGVIAFFLVIVLSTVFSFEANAAYNFSKIQKDSPEDFKAFLLDCTYLERIQLMQSLKALPKLKDEYFGTLKDLPPLYSFTEDKEEATNTRPLRPSTFNEVSPETVFDAVSKNILEFQKTCTIGAVQKELVYRAHNKLTYVFRDVEKVDYHSIVQWIADENGVSKAQRKALSTFYLERSIVENFFATIWDKLSIEERKELLDRIERETGIIPNKGAIISMSGAGAIAALSATVALAGFKFYVMLTVTIHAVAAFLGLTLPFIVYQTATSTIALLAGPVGWLIAGILSTAGVFFLASAEEEEVSAFIMTVHTIKASRWKDKL
jgi:uncharacterized protein YaaW (UPF0174 family)